MQFDLDEALIDQILFAMEDQEGEFLLDTQEGLVCTVDEINEDGEDPWNEDRYISLPSWASNDGFRLMEKFTAGLRNPLVKNELTNALDRGRGVFRAFKNTLSNHPPVEQLWYTFKEREMKRAILDWYNALREEWGLERIGEEPEETEDLILEDFHIRSGVPADEEKARVLHEECLKELEATFERNSSTPQPAALGQQAKQPWHFPSNITLVAETNRGDFAGYITAHQQESLLNVEALEVYTEYRGLGLAETLLTRVIETVKKEKSEIQYLQLSLPALYEEFSRVLLRKGFQIYETRYLCTLGHTLE